MKNNLIEYFTLTDRGKVRNNNQDSVGCCYRNDGDFLAVVSDGIGGHNGGDIASKMVTSLLMKYFVEYPNFSSEDEIIEFINDSCYKINKNVYDKAQNEPDLTGMGATLTALLISQFGVFWLNVGDSRIYKLDQQLTQVSIDHTLVNELIRSNRITADQALNHPKKHHITKAIGIWEKIEIDFGKILEPAQYFLLCSDGLYGMVDDRIMQEIIKDQNLSLIHKTKKLLNMSLKAGGLDNISIILIKVVKGEHNE